MLEGVYVVFTCRSGKSLLLAIQVIVVVFMRRLSNSLLVVQKRCNPHSFHVTTSALQQTSTA